MRAFFEAIACLIVIFFMWLIDMAKKKPWESIYPKQKTNTMKAAQAAVSKPTAIGIDLGKDTEDNTAFVSMTNAGSQNYINFINTYSTFNFLCNCPVCQPNLYTASQLQSYQQIYNDSQLQSYQQAAINQIQNNYIQSSQLNSYQSYVNSQQLYNTKSLFKTMSIGMLFAGGEVIKFDPDPAYPDTMGWRCWDWCVEEKALLSPVVPTFWHDAELRCDKWDESEVIRGCSGIHARIVPVDWENTKCPEGNGNSTTFYKDNNSSRTYIQIDGLVERFGRYVLGEVGWRTEWAIIRKLKAPNTEIGLALESKFPDVEIIYENK